MSLPMLDECTLDLLYDWLDAVPFSKPRKNIARDFSDGVLVAELVAHYLPRCVDLHCFAPANSVAIKKYNWEMLNKRVFNKLNFQVTPNSIHQVVQCKPGAIELVLMNLRPKIESALANGRLLKPPTSGRFRSRSVSRSKEDEVSKIISQFSGSYVRSYGSSLSLASTAGSLSSSNCSRQRSRQDIIDDMMKSYTNSLLESETCPTLPVPNVSDETTINSLKEKLKEKEEECKNLNLRCTHYEKLMEAKDEKIRQLTARLDRLAQAVCAQTTNFNDFTANNQKPRFSFR